MNTPTTLPACLTRTAADDREEATREVFGLDPEGQPWESGEGPRVDAALAAIQRHEAEAIWKHARDLGAHNVARDVAEWAYNEMHYARPSEGYSLDQRGRLLDAARALVRLALEVAAR
jgi:hypothetical protein